MSCCPPDSEPSRVSSPHAGTTFQYGKTTLYRTGPATAEVGILAFPDAFGPESGRTKADADRLGKLGFAVVLVDVTGGDWLGLNTDYYTPWPASIQRADFDTVIYSAANDAITFLKTEAQVSKLVSYGYCFGGWVGARLSVVPTEEVLGHVSFHPSWSVENMFHGDGGAEAFTHGVTVPQLLLSAENEPGFVRAGGSVDAILKTKPGKVGSLSKVINFDDVKHGWVNRGALDDPVVKKSIDLAWKLAIEFFHEVV